MLHTTQGIVLRSVKYGETSLIFDVFTADWGLRTYIVHGVRQEKSRISPILVRPTAIVEMVVYHNEQRGINNIREIRPAYIYQRLPFSVRHGAVGLLIGELLQKSLREAEADADLYRFITQTLQMLDNQEEVSSSFYLIFMAQLPFYLGFAPQLEDFDEGRVFDYREGRFVRPVGSENVLYFDEESSRILVDLCCTPLEEAADLDIAPDDRQRLYRNLLDFYSFHLPSFVELQSYEVLRQLF